MSELTKETVSVTESQTASDSVKETSSSTEEKKRCDSEGDASPEIHFEPIVQLPLVNIQTMEESEEELVKLRAKLYRYDTSETPPEFKERGTGDVKILKHSQTGVVRILMRRDKTLKVCANHCIQPKMELKKHNNSEKVFIWSTLADYVDDTPKAETLAIRFGSVEIAQKFKDAFEEGKRIVTENALKDIAQKLGIVNLDEDDQSDDDEDSNEDDESDDDDTPEADRHVNEENETKNNTQNE